MSVDTSHTTARLSALVIDRQCCCSARCLLSIAFKVVRIAETQRQHRSFKPDLPIELPQSQDPRALSASGTRHAEVKSP
ncbi:MAG: hypothetical protein WA633_22430 [Stellaceae bacterium]